MHISLTSEQQRIVNKIAKYNICIDSLTGTGKYTVLSHIVSTSKKSIILYNVKKHSYDFHNMRAMSFSSFDRKYYAKTQVPYLYHLFIISDAHLFDMHTFELFIKFLSNNLTQSYKIALFGDRYKAISNNNIRFIAHSGKLFNITKFPWLSIYLSESFTLTAKIAQFINKCILPNANIIGKNTVNNNNVRYIICDLNKSCQSFLFQEINNYLACKYTYNDIIITVPSTNNNNYIRVIIHLLTQNNLPVCVYSGGEKTLNISNKIIICNFNIAHNFTRKVAIICGFDNSYSADSPNELYIALTRGTHRLSLFHHYSYDYLPFIDPTVIHSICSFYDETPDDTFNNQPVVYTHNNIGVMNFIKQAKTYITDDISNKLKTKSIPSKHIALRLSQHTNDNGIYESIAEITGIAVPSYFQFITTGNMYIHDILIKNNNNFAQTMALSKNISVYNLLKLATEYHCFVSGYSYKLKQISEYNWISIGQLRKINAVLKKIISPKSLYEIKIMYKNITGFIDCIDPENNTVYEFKCIHNNIITTEHLLQLAIYKFMFLSIRKYINDNITLYNTVFNIGDSVLVKINDEYCDGVINTIISDNSYSISVNSNNNSNNIFNSHDIINKTIFNKKHNFNLLPVFIQDNIPVFHIINLLTCNIYELTNDYPELEHIFNIINGSNSNNNITDFFNECAKIKKSYYPNIEHTNIFDISFIDKHKIKIKINNK